MVARDRGVLQIVRHPVEGGRDLADLVPLASAMRYARSPCPSVPIPAMSRRMSSVGERASSGEHTPTSMAPAPVARRTRRRVLAGAKASAVSSVATMPQRQSGIARGAYAARTGAVPQMVTCRSDRSEPPGHPGS